jgi:hypothetical protein
VHVLFYLESYTQYYKFIRFVVPFYKVICIKFGYIE